MNVFNEWFPENEIKQFINKSTPSENSNLQLFRSKEDAGWVYFYFKNNGSDFRILITLVTSDLSDIVSFFENIINLKEDTAVFLDNELVSTPLLYVSPVDNEKIRFLVADEERINTLFEDDKFNEDDSKGIFDYDVKCDVIVEKKKLLKEFYRAIKNIINNCVIDEFYNINYTNWKDKLKNIIKYIIQEK